MVKTPKNGPFAVWRPRCFTRNLLLLLAIGKSNLKKCPNLPLKIMRRIFFLVGFCFFSAVLSVRASTVERIVINGVINPVAVEYIEQAISRAGSDQAELLIIQLDTPGGLMESMHRIMKSIQGSSVPVAVYVAPSGSRAASAGMFITYAAHVTAMAPATNIGSAHPVFSGGMPGGKMDSSTSETMMEKITNDAVAKIKAIAHERGRNAEWAEKAIRHSANITAKEALKLHVIDYIVPTTDSLLSVLDGKSIKLDNGTKKILHTKNSTIITTEMTWRQRLLDTILNPNVAYILMMVGMAGVMLELYHPGAILPGVAGVISLVLAFYAMQTLPVNYAGVALILFAVVLFILEIKVTSYGILSIGGVISMALGSLMLFDSPLPEMQLSLSVIGWTVILTLLFFLFVISLAVKAQQRRPITGAEGIIGEHGVVSKTLNPLGTVLVHGEYWKARCEEKLPVKTEVTVTGLESGRLILKVKKKV